MAGCVHSSGVYSGESRGYHLTACARRSWPEQNPERCCPPEYIYIVEYIFIYIERVKHSKEAKRQLFGQGNNRRVAGANRTMFAPHL